MSDYAVVNPATGETVARYDTFTDAQVEQTLAAAAAGFEPGARSRSASGPGWSGALPNCIGNAARNWPPSSSGRWAR